MRVSMDVLTFLLAVMGAGGIGLAVGYIQGVADGMERRR